jgi:hypothetical protein
MIINSLSIRVRWRLNDHPARAWCRAIRLACLGETRENQAARQFWRDAKRMKRLLVHVGYPKAASTSLQNGLFLALHRAKAINFLGRAFESGFYGTRRNKGDFKAWFDHVISPASDEKNSIGILSDRTTNFLSEGLFMMNERHSDRIVGPELLQKHFSHQADQIDVMIIIRKQEDLVPSYYFQNYRKLQSDHFADFLEQNQRHRWTGEAKIFNFCDVAQAYATVFGKDHVHILFFEDFVRNRERFSAELAKVMDVDAGVIKTNLGESQLNETRKEAGTVVVKKLRPGYLWRTIKLLELAGLKFADRLRHRIPAVTVLEKRQIFEAFKDSNLRLAEGFGLDKRVMQEYGYF